MDSDEFENEIRDFYRSAHLDGDRLESLLTATETTHRARHRRNVAIGTTLGLVAMVVFALAILMRDPPSNRTGHQRVVRDSQRDTQTVAPQSNDPLKENGNSDRNGNRFNTNDARPPETIARPRYQLVAVRSHGDGCPYCRETGEVFDQLVVALRDEPIECHVIHLGESSANELARQLSDFRLKKRLEGRRETAFFALIERSEGCVAEYKPSMTAERITARIRSHLVASRN